MGYLPITSKLLPFRWRNLVYLAEVAALTRMATGVARVLENRPSKQNDPRLSQNEKRQALTERFFVEILGTAGYMAFLHLGQDLVDKISASKASNWIKAPKIPTFAELPANKKAKLGEALQKFGLTVEQFDQKIKDLYNPDRLNPDQARSGLIYRVLYEHEAPLRDQAGVAITDVTGKPKLITEKATLAELQKKIAKYHTNKLDKAQVTKDFKNVLGHCKELEEFACNSNKWAAASILTGVALSATVGGTLTQWMNDRLIAPTAKHWLNKKFESGSVKPGAVQPAALKPVGLPQPQRPVMTPQALPQVQAANPFNFPPANVAMPLPPVIAPVYVPNPKMQPPAMAFGAKTLPRPYTTPLSSYASTRLGGGL